MLVKHLTYDPNTDEFVLWDDTGQGENVDFTSHAETQFLGRIKVPAGYIHRCPNTLKAHNINYWIGQFGEKLLTLRYKGDYVRAIFSSRYSCQLDDHILIPVALEALELACKGEPDNLHLKTFLKTTDFTLLRALFKDAKIVHNGHTYFAGVSICNSEVGRSSIWIRPVIRGGNEWGAYDYVDRSREGCLSIRHIGDLCTNEIKLAIVKAREASEVGIYRLLEASQEIVESPIKTVRKLVEDSDFLTTRLTDIIEEEYKDRIEATKLELARSMLNAIKELPLFQRCLAEREIGRYLDLFRDTANRLDAIVIETKKLEQHVHV